MAIAALAVKQRGVGNGNSQVVRMAGSSVVNIGRSFTILWFTAGVIGGPFQVGETVTGATSATQGVVIALNLAGFGNTIWVSITNGSAFTLDESVTGGTSGAHGLAHGIGIANNTSVGTFAPEQSASASRNNASNRAMSFKGELYCALGTYILKLVGNDWQIAHTLTNPLSFNQNNCHTGLHVVNINNQPVMAMLYGAGPIRRVSTADGISFNEVQISTDGFLSTLGIQRETLYNNILYMLAGTSNTGAQVEVFSWDPNSDTFVQNVGSLGLLAASYDLSVYNNNLIILKAGTGNQAAIFAYLGGTWTEVLTFTDGNIAGGGNPAGNMQWAMWSVGDGFLYCMYGAYFNPSGGWVVKKVQVVGGVWSDVTPVVGGVKTLGPTVFFGTGISYWRSNATLFDPDNQFVQVVVDNVTTPGTPVAYLYVAINDTAGTTWSVYQWVGPSSVVTIIGSGGDVANAMAFVRAGGGERIWTYEQPDIDIVNVLPVPGGERLYFVAYPGETQGTVSVTNGLATVVGNGTTFTTSFVNGNTLIFSNQPGVIYTILSITDDTHLTLTGTFSGTTNAATAAGLSGVKNVSFVFNQQGTPPTSTCTIYNPVSPTNPNPPTPGTALPVTGGFQQLTGVTLDGVTQYQITWNATQDGAVNLTRVSIQPSVF